WNNTETFLDAFAESGFDVFVGSESFLLANMRNGGAGTISATANLNPAAIYELYAACVGESKFENRESELEQQQARLNVVRDVFSSRKIPSIIAAIKQAIVIYSNDPEWARVRPPLLELTTEQAKLLAKELQAIHFAMDGMERTSFSEQDTNAQRSTLNVQR